MPDSKPPDPNLPPEAYAVLRNRDLRIYLTGRLIAIIGQQMFAMALGWELYERTGSALALGFVGLTQVIPMIVCTLPSGHFADRYNRKRIIVLMTMIFAAVNIALAGISAARARTVDLLLPRRHRHGPDIPVGSQRVLSAATRRAQGLVASRDVE